MTTRGYSVDALQARDRPDIGAELNALDLLLGHEVPTRRTLKTLNHVASPAVGTPIGLAVHRTFPFEWVSSVLDPFLALSNWTHVTSYSDYDPGLATLAPSKPGDMHLLWIDWRTYMDRSTPEEIVDWLVNRLDAIRALDPVGVLVNNWPTSTSLSEVVSPPDRGTRGWLRSLNHRLDALVAQIDRCLIVDLEQLVASTGPGFIDLTNDKETYFPFSSEAAIRIARHIGVHLVPALVAPRLKALAIDMDDTLYAGVLGEEGVDGVVLTQGHRLLQATLSGLKESGMLLCLCSRNEQEDARELFAIRSDFPLRWDDFAAVAINWEPKSQNPAFLAEQLNIGLDSFLFLDDNPAELIKARASIPGLCALRAHEDATETTYRLCHYPGLYQAKGTEADALRNEDIKANRLRRELLQHTQGDQSAYLSQLEMIVELSENALDHRERVHQLSQKTNQFNLNCLRCTWITPTH